MRTLLVPVDFSAGTYRIVAAALALARETHARMVLLNVTTPAALPHDHAAMERLVADFTPPDGTTEHVAGEFLQLIGEPVAVILEQAQKLGADYIVIGSHGHSALRRLVLGSTARGVMAGARCPVMIVSLRPPVEPRGPVGAPERSKRAPPRPEVAASGGAGQSMRGVGQAKRGERRRRA
jgi:nucleotide-binding universal stress UspA family protein